MVAKTRIFFQRRSLGLILIALALVLGMFAFIQNSKSSRSSIELVYAQNLVSINPFTYADYNNSRLNYIYESLVTFSEDLKIAPKLAVSFGQISPSHYRFRIKDNVFFHNGQHLTAEYLKSLFANLSQFESQKPLIANITDFQVTGDYQFDIYLQNPDPLFLSKLASVPIAFVETDLIANPIGTGPFMVKAQSQNQIYLEPFSNYHAKQARFKQLLLTTIPNQTQRLEYSLSNPNVLAVFGVSPVLEDQLTQANFDLENYVEGSTNFFLYNYNRKLSQNPHFRTALRQAMQLDMNFRDFSEGMAKDTNQLLASGVFGYNPNIQPLDLLELPATTFQPQILMPIGFDNLADKLTQSLQKHGIEAEFTFANSFELSSAEISSQYDLIFFGFKSDFYDGHSFFTTFLESETFNFGSYKNPQANQLLQELESLQKPKARQKVLQELSSLLVEASYPLAEPLFESQVYYALSHNYILEPRLDGYLDLTLIQY